MQASGKNGIQSNLRKFEHFERLILEHPYFLKLRCTQYIIMLKRHYKAQSYKIMEQIMGKSNLKKLNNPFHANGFFLYSLKTLKNLSIKIIELMANKVN